MIALHVLMKQGPSVHMTFRLIMNRWASACAIGSVTIVLPVSLII